MQAHVLRSICWAEGTEVNKPTKLDGDLRIQIDLKSTTIAKKYGWPTKFESFGGWTNTTVAVSGIGNILIHVERPMSLKEAFQHWIAKISVYRARNKLLKKLRENRYPVAQHSVRILRKK